jgi:hypothetical protein
MFEGEAIQSTNRTIHFSENPKRYHPAELGQRRTSAFNGALFCCPFSVYGRRQCWPYQTAFTSARKLDGSVDFRHTLIGFI